MREAYADWLHGYNWDYFFTATFRTNNTSPGKPECRVYKGGELTHTIPGEPSIQGKGLARPRKEPYYALQTVWGELQVHGVARGFLVAEPHQSGDLHTHGIIAGAGFPWAEDISLPWQIWGGLYDRFGRAKVEAPRGKGEAVTMYCSKYLLKQQHRACDYYEIFGDKRFWHAGVLEKTAIERAAIREGFVFV